ncbi:MAG: hypothetical protein R3F11_28055 [Verrucomicrobiales bacterium]
MIASCAAALAVWDFRAKAAPRVKALAAYSGGAAAMEAQSQRRADARWAFYGVAALAALSLPGRPGGRPHLAFAAITLAAYLRHPARHLPRHQRARGRPAEPQDERLARRHLRHRLPVHPRAAAAADSFRFRRGCVSGVAGGGHGVGLVGGAVFDGCCGSLNLRNPQIKPEAKLSRRRRGP